MCADSHPVVLINPFEVPPDRDTEFVTRWERARDFLAGREGYLDTALHRSLAPEAEFRFVNVARWRSPRDFQAAMAARGFPGRQLPYVSHPALSEVVAETTRLRGRTRPGRTRRGWSRRGPCC
jgi:heme oxygenase (mycobilin-producing)